MTSTPAVSFIMPAYNVGDFLEYSVLSVQNQSFNDWELLIIDDGSTDRTLEIAAALSTKDSRIKVIQMEKASGSAYQPRKKGILSAKAPLVAPLDADDFIAPGYTQNLLSLHKKYNADIVYPTMYYYNGITSELKTPQDLNLLNRPLKGKDCVKFTLDFWRINCNGGIIRKDLYLNAYELYDSSVCYSCADELLTRQLLYLANIVVLSPAEYYYRNNPESITKKKSLKLFDYIKNNRELIFFTEKNYGLGSEENILAQRQNFHGVFAGLRLMNKHKFIGSEKKEAYWMIQTSRELFDYEFLKGKVSPRYSAISRLGLSKIRVILKYFDLINKNLFFLR